jgi:flagellar biosynthesis protein FlhB
MSDKSGKTEQPTQKRLEKARKDGNFPQAKEFVAALQFFVFLALLSAGGAHWLQDFRQTTRSLFHLAFTRELQAVDFTHIAWQMFQRHFLPMLAGGMAVVAASVAFRLVTTRGGISFKKLVPDAQRFNPLSKLSGLPKQNLPAVIQAAIMLPVFLWAVYAAASGRLEAFLTLPMQSVEAGTAFFGASLMDLFWKAAMVFMLFGSVDLVRQIRKHNAELRMSKQDIRDEMKEAEGNPQMKARIRRLQRDRARKQMMKEIPTATAVIVNPTHYAVAIRYNMDGMAAPLVVAKGKNYLALRIKQRAIDHQVPIIENVPLAQALYKSVDVGQEIPAHLYRAVAEILAYIFKLMNGRLPGKP